MNVKVDPLKPLMLRIETTKQKPKESGDLGIVQDGSRAPSPADVYREITRDAVLDVRVRMSVFG